ncbi:MAG: winged helix-turn-helix domain-containing protein [Rhodanobacteraceae bacterium]
MFLPWAGAVSVQENRVYRFADCELDPHERRLLAHGHAVTLTPKVFDTLVLLVMRAGHAVSKDELMAALWPRGFVHESNLTKHIWTIRRALGDHGGESRYIETLPKLGYRFIAQVSSVAAPSLIIEDATAALASLPSDRSNHDTVPNLCASNDAAAVAAVSVTTFVDESPSTMPVEASSASTDPHRRRGDRWRPLLVAGLIAIAVVIAGAIAYRFFASSNAMLAMRAAKLDPGAVAIADFSNLSRNDKDAWLGPALAEMLATEIAVGGKLHAVSDELVRPARADLPAPAAGGYAPASLATLQRRLGAHYVLSGAYLVSGANDAPQLRVDLAVQDTRSGAAVATLSRSGAVADLPRLVAQAGATLRHGFGEQTVVPEELLRVANAQPPSAEVARHIGFALDALHTYDPARARDELLQAIAQAPGYAPAYMYLAQAWSSLGYRAKALAASKQALTNAQGLPQEQYLQIEAQQFDLQADHAQAIDTWQKLVALRPQNPEYRFQLIDAQIDAGKPDDAEVSLNALRKLFGDAGDPRIEFAAARIAATRDNNPAYIEYARLALQQAQARGETGLIANAELQLGIALPQQVQAEPLLRKAATDFRRGGNPHGEARAWQNLGNLQFANNQIAPARETYQRAMTIYQGIGDLGGEAAIYDELARMLWAAGDRDGAEAATRQSLRIARETGDLVRQGWNLTALGIQMSDETASDAIASMYRQAIALDERAGSVSHRVFALAAYADLLRERGELDRANEVCTQARSSARALNDPGQSAGVDVICAEIALDRGEVDAAVTSMTALATTATTAKDTFSAANAQMIIGQIALGRQQWTRARDALQQSLAGWTATQEPAGEAVTSGLLALCYAALGDTAARDRAVAQARELRSRVNERAEVLPLDIALAELQGMTGPPDAAITALQALADDADKRQWIGMALEARLAALRLQERGGDPAVAKAARVALTASARKLGYGWVLQRLVAAR